MRELVILSGKGGTGKTSLTAAFASFSSDMILCDADVDAADLHLLMAPDIQQKTDFQGGNEAIINPDKCTRCGLCIELCRFDAVKSTFEIDPIECEGCGVCYDLCPEKAIDFPVTTCGEWYISDTRFGPMVHARLGIAQENSGRLVALVRQEARKIVQKNKIDLILTDGPPGIGCPVIASMGQANAILIVAEPTISGIHDLARLAQLAAHFKIPAIVCVNKYDLNLDQTKAIKDLAKEKNITFAGVIPFDKNFTESMIQGKNIIETYENSQASIAVRKIWEKVMAQPAMNIERLI
ncbi:MAG: P-loop NTPase [Desulfobacula sp.]|jgi:MinD superfamily P-loop ATPase|uniref:ATP-binding protein n=1 Tax=Desulfobacula sp. TaxID=2593537 RepID=UPI001DF39AD4|nr:P-loop NTPase [Desulfobacula sp.]MBT3486702.1 P-loop NTPase [Desulfobacula sp.]MBT3805120.1 P-loop NTPase [Desulfobacula sp.]MBT4026038.1 P-loop NTPase [Desulfobacula sp.]MBT4199795.1 P-loop NTPase [Desulfobacula sp.]